MGYTLEAILAKPAVLAKAPFELEDSKIIYLTPELSMLPVTPQFLDSMGQGTAPNKFFDSFHYLSQPLAEACSSLSQFGIVAYVEAEFFGGVGQQVVVAWENQQIAMGPLEDAGAINKALRLFGVKRGRGGDEFDSVDLGRHRETEEWLSAG